MKKIAILQSNYIPWKGYFDLINKCDVFVIFDDVQYTKNDWRNRNRIKTNQGVKWLTIPVRQEGLDQRINQTKIADARWGRKHWASLSQNYNKSLFYKDYFEVFEHLYLTGNDIYLSEINYKFLNVINEILGIDTVIMKSEDFDLLDEKSERLLGICKSLKASTYISGPSASSYLNTEIFIQEGIAIEFMDYEGYKEYPQLYPPFVHDVTILDMIFNIGPNVTSYLKSF